MRVIRIYMKLSKQYCVDFQLQRMSIRQCQEVCGRKVCLLSGRILYLSIQVNWMLMRKIRG